MATQQSWVFGHGLNVENPENGNFRRSTLYSTLTLHGDGNWVLAAVPAPSPGWQVAAIMVRYYLPTIGGIDKVGLRDGERPVVSFEDLKVAGPSSNWETLSLPLATPTPFEYGLGVGVHVVPPDPIGSTGTNPGEIRIIGVGLEFTD